VAFGFGKLVQRALDQRRAAPAPEAFRQSQNTIQVPDLGRKLVTRYGLREKSPTPTLAPEVQAVVLVDDLTAESDLIRPRIRPVSGRLAVTGATTPVVLGLQNPIGSGIIIHTQFATLDAIGAGIRGNFFFNTVAAGATIGTQVYRNGLFVGNPPAGRMIGGTTAIAGGTIFARGAAPSTVSAVYPLDFVLAPGQVIQWQSESVTLTVPVDCGFVWTEEDER